MLLSEIFSYENKNTYRLCDINTNRGNRLIRIGGLARIYQDLLSLTCEYRPVGPLM